MASAIKGYKGMGMEGSIARWYDKATRNDMPEFQSLATRIAGSLGPGATVLEVAPGPGFLSIELARRGLQVRAVDISKTFVELAQRNAAVSGVNVQFEVGNAAALPLEDANVDFVVCRAAFKNFTEPVKALAEMHRVLRFGGTALLIDLRRDTPVSEIKRYVDKMGFNFFNRWFTMLTFRGMLLRRAYFVEDVRQMISKAGWTESRIEISPLGFEAWMMK